MMNCIQKKRIFNPRRFQSVLCLQNLSGIRSIIPSRKIDRSQVLICASFSTNSNLSLREKEDVRIEKMTGAESVVRTLVQGGVNVFFSNPGTSEINFVAATDVIPNIHPILCLFEGVVTGAADGYGRMLGKPAATLLHLGPGMANGIASLHNADKAGSPVINIVGEHATFHLGRNAPLELSRGSIEELVSPVSPWVRISSTPHSLANDTAEAINSSYTAGGQVSTLICHADAAWGTTPINNVSSVVASSIQYNSLDKQSISRAASIVRSGEQVVFLLQSSGLYKEALQSAAQICQSFPNCMMISDTFPIRYERGGGRVPIIPQLPYYAEDSIELLKNAKHLIMVGANPPVAFFAYPNVPRFLEPESCKNHVLASADQDCVKALQWLADDLSLPSSGWINKTIELSKLSAPQGDLDPLSIATSVAMLCPNNAIISAEPLSAIGPCNEMIGTYGPPHDWLFGPMGGAIGQGIPLAIGAAVACPNRKVITLQADGSAMYTIQGLWTQSRENLDILTIIFNNRKYAILEVELSRVSGNIPPGPNSLSQLSLDNPPIDFTKLAEGMGVPAKTAHTSEEFHKILEYAIRIQGPFLIEAVY